MRAERNKRRKAKVASSTCSFSGFSPSMLVPLCELLSSFESAIVTSVASTSSCSVAFSMSSLLFWLSRSFPPNVPFTGEPSRKRRKEDSGAVLISKDETWEEFQKC